MCCNHNFLDSGLRHMAHPLLLLLFLFSHFFSCPNFLQHDQCLSSLMFISVIQDLVVQSGFCYLCVNNISVIQDLVVHSGFCYLFVNNIIVVLSVNKTLVKMFACVSVFCFFPSSILVIFFVHSLLIISFSAETLFSVCKLGTPQNVVTSQDHCYCTWFFSLCVFD